MKKLSTYLLIFFMAMFWGFRVVLSFGISMGWEMGVSIPNMQLEVILLFVTIVFFLFIVKRKVIGAILYVIAYGAYFGPVLYQGIMKIIEGTLGMGGYLDCMMAFIGIILPVAVLFDLLFDKNRMAHPVDKKTDWFYKNKEYDRKLDERADKNNYRTL